MKGWITLHRQIENNPLWLLEPFTKAQAWVDLILNANHTDGYFMVRGIKIEIKRGQIGWSELTMAKRWKWSRMKVRRFLKYLDGEQQTIQQKIDKITSITTIINYSKYQTIQQKDNRRDNRRDTNNNVNNVNNDLGETDVSPLLNLKDKQKASMGWGNNRGDDADEFVVDYDSGEVKDTAPVSKKKYPNAPAIRKLFSEILGINPADWRKNTTVLQACENLYSERGLDKVRNALEFYKENKDTKYCPVIASPLDLDRKYTNLSQFKTKHEN